MLYKVPSSLGTRNFQVDMNPHTTEICKRFCLSHLPKPTHGEEEMKIIYYKDSVVYFSDVLLAQYIQI